MRVTEAELPEELPVRNNIVRAMYANPDMFRGFASLSGRVHSASHLPDRIRELVVLRITGMLGAEVEWRPHAKMAGRLGLTDTHLEAIREGDFGLFSDSERAALEYAGAIDTRTVDDDVWKRARAHYSEIELVDMTQLAGFYGLAARVALALEIEPDA
jgi:4-carboxymuconolactone decarboxylase